MKQDGADRVQLRFEQIRTQCLRPEEVRYESVTLLNDGETLKCNGTQIWSRHIRTLSRSFPSIVGSDGQRLGLARPSEDLRAKISRFHIWLGSQSCRQCTAVNCQCSYGDGFKDGFVLPSQRPQCLK